MAAPATIGEALQAEVAQRQISHRSAGEILGCSQQAFSRWASGEDRPRPEYRVVLAHFLHLKLSDYDALWRASTKPRGDRGTAIKITKLEKEVEELRRLLVQIAAQVGLKP